MYPLRSNRGYSLVEVLVSLGIVVGVAFIALPFYSNQKKISSNYEAIGLCQSYLSQAMNRLDSSAGVIYERPKLVARTKTFARPDEWSTVLPIYSIDPSRKVSLNPNNNRTFFDRFSFFEVPQDAAGNFLLYKTNGPGTLRTYRGSDVIDITTEADGVLMYTPLLLKGTIADIADLYNISDYRGQASSLPDHLNPVTLKSGNQYPAVSIQMQIDRIFVGSGAVSNAGSNVKFWPIPRNGVGNTLPSDTDKYSIRAPDDNAVFKSSGIHTIRMAQIPQQAHGIEMSWDYGFRVSMKAEVTTLDGQGGERISNCFTTKDYFLPTDFHNIISYKNDFDFIVNNTVQNQSLSTKFFDSDNLSYSNNRRTTYDNTDSDVSSNMILDPRIMAIFANTNFGTGAGGVPNAKYGKDRPECSQNGDLTKKFEMRIIFKNLHKEPGVIPVCQDLSVHTIKDKDNPTADKIWCEGAPDAEVRVVNDFAPGQTGFVPCEQMRFCGQIPDSVKVIVDDQKGDIEYRYRYTFTNDNNSARNRLWGCDMFFATALVDPSGNTTYLPGQKLSEAFVDVDKPGFARPLLAGTPAKIYFKPPPCWYCDCKPCKGSKGLLGLIVGLIVAAVAIYFGIPPMATSLSAVAFEATVYGVMLTLGASCGIQWIGEAGACGSSGYSEPNSNHKVCSQSRSGGNCSCGRTCSRKVPVPDPVSFKGGDVPAGFQDNSILGYCGYEKITATTDGVSWIVQRGARLANGQFDTSAIITEEDYRQGGPVPQGKQFTPLNGTSYYTMLNTDTGQYFLMESICVWSDSAGHPVWQVNRRQIDGQPFDSAIEHSRQVKMGYELNFNADGTVSKGSPRCLNAALQYEESDIWSCSEFEIACYNGNEIFSIDSLNLTFGEYTNIAGRRSNTAATPDPDQSSYKTVEKAPAICSQVEVRCEENPCGNPPTSGMYSPGNGSSYPRNDTCNSSVSNFTYACNLSCSVSGGGCVANNSNWGSCTYHPEVRYTTGGGTTGEPLVEHVTPAYCTASPGTCYGQRFYKFDSWKGCTRPRHLDLHLIEDKRGMLCYEPFATGLNIDSMCGSGGGLSNSVDTKCPAAGDSLCRP